MPGQHRHHLRPQRVGWHDAEITADIGDDGGRRTMTQRGGDFLRRWQIGKAGAPNSRPGRVRLSPHWCVTASELERGMDLVLDKVKASV